MKRFMMTIAAGLLALFATTAAAHAQGAGSLPFDHDDGTIDPQLPTLWIIGDSTVKNGTRGQVGWGDPIKDLFDRTKINVVNRAIGGRSSRTFRTDGRWDAVLSVAKAGDTVIMQFGHNDPGPLVGGTPLRERGTIKGMGDETEEVTLTMGSNAGKKEVVHTFGWYMKQYCSEAKAKGMSAIVCSYVPRAPHIPGDNAAPTTSAAPIESDATPPLSSYALWAKQSGEATGATFVDLYSIINSHYAKESPQDVKKKYFTDADNTHQSPAGALLNAQCVVEGLRAAKSPLVEFLAAK